MNTYTIQGMTGYQTSNRDRAIDYAELLAFQNATKYRVLKDGKLTHETTTVVYQVGETKTDSWEYAKNQAKKLAAKSPVKLFVNGMVKFMVQRNGNLISA